MRHSSVEITDKTYTHLDVNDLSLILNSKQKIISEGLTINQMIENVLEALKSSGIKEDPRFTLNIYRNSTKKEMTIRIKY